MLAQLAIMAVPALSVVLAPLWGMDASEIGWLGGIYFAGYALTLPFLPARQIEWMAALFIYRRP
jgi:hypothetical protein